MSTLKELLKTTIIGGVLFLVPVILIALMLRHAMGEHRKVALRALVFIGDAVEESPDNLCGLAGQCGLLQMPLFLFQEGREPKAEQTFKEIARPVLAYDGSQRASAALHTAAELASSSRSVPGSSSSGS